ncbi:MAG: sensor histidine kinase, partial [Anaerolineales bacterium]
GPASPVVEELKRASRLVDDTIKEVRQISADLRPGALDDLGLEAAIDWQLRDFEQRTGLACRLLTDEAEPLAITPEAATSAYRILQEALTNVVRHARATEVQVRVETEAERFVMQIRDNGRGFALDPDVLSNSLGLLGMRERANNVGGSLDIVGVAGQGTVVKLTLPLTGTVTETGKAKPIETPT